MRNILFLLSIFLLSSCHLKTCKVIRYNEASKEIDTFYVENYLDYDYHEYCKTVTFQDYWHNNTVTYNNVIEIIPAN